MRQRVRQRVLENSSGQSNVAVIGVHSHSGPGVFSNYLLPQISTLGVDKQNFWANVNNIVLSVQKAHESATEGYLNLGKGPVDDAEVNRSPYTCYEHNR